MKLQQGASSVDIASIIVDREGRQRREIKTEDLEKSISKRGLLTPIIVSDKLELRAGERRLTACRNLGHTKILVRKISDLSPVEAQIIELEENIKRQDLDWQDAAKAVARIHKLYLALDPDWTMAETAEECAITQGTVSLYLIVEAELDQERVAKAGTVREAYNMLSRKAQRQAGIALQELLDGPDMVPVKEPVLSPEDEKEAAALIELGQPLPARLVVAAPKPAAPPPPPPEQILQLSFLDWAPQYSGPKFNLVHCDFPYGIDFASGPQGRGSEMEVYEDAAGVYQTLLESLCQNLDRVMSLSGHLMFWLSADSRIVHKTQQTFAQLAPSLAFHRFPLIWTKSDASGVASDPRRGPRHVYEMCLLASRGDRNIAKVKADSYTAPPDRQLHPSTKPEPMLRHFMEMLVDETTSLLDPTCGSGAALRAADSLGADRVLGLEIDSNYVQPARVALRQAQAKRAASRSIEL